MLGFHGANQQREGEDEGEGEGEARARAVRDTPFPSAVCGALMVVQCWCSGCSWARSVQQTARPVLPSLLFLLLFAADHYSVADQAIEQGAVPDQ